MFALVTPRARMILAVCLVAALCIDFLLYTGFFASDDIAYLGGAQMVAERSHYVGPPELQPVLSISRLGMTIPTGIVYWLTDGSAAAIAWSFILWHLLLVVLAYAVGRLVHGENTGLVAAALAATSPMLTVYAGAVLPDNPTAVWLGILLLLLELVRRREPLDWRRAARWYLAAGFTIGLAYSVKETGIIFAVPAGICVMAAAPRLRNPVWIRNGAFMAAGLGLFMLLEQIAIRLITGSWVFRLGLVQDFGDIYTERMSWQGGMNPFSRFWYALDGRLLKIAPITTFLLLACALAYPFLLRRRGRSLALQIFFWWPVVYLTIGSTSFTSYMPPSIQGRYYALAIVPGTVMTAAVIGELVRRWRAWARPPEWARGRGTVLALVLGLIAVSCHEVDVNLPRSGGIYAAARVRGFIATYERAREAYPQYPIVLGKWYGRRMMPIFLRWDEVDDIYAGEFGLRARPPEPPYIALEWVRRVKDDGDEPGGGLERRTLEVVYPPRSRVDELSIAVRRLFGLEAPRDLPVSLVGGGAIQLVTRRGDPIPAGLGVPAPFLGKGGVIRSVDGGHLVSWSAGEEPMAQLLERGSVKTPPTHPMLQLATPARRVRLTVPLRLVGGDNVTVACGAYGYRADGGVIEDARKLKLVGGAAPIHVSLELTGDPMTSYRLRIAVKSKRRAGVLYVGEPQVDSLPETAPVPPPAGAPPPEAP